MQGFFAKNHGSPKYRLVNKEGETIPVILDTISIDSRDSCATFEGAVLPGSSYRKTTERTINDVWPTERDFLTEKMRAHIYGDFPDHNSEYAKYVKNDIKSTELMIKHVRNERYFGIKKVIFNDPATIVFWQDGSKTVVKCQEGDIFDPEKGLAMVISKRALGDKGNFNDVFKKWVGAYEPKRDEKEATITLELPDIGKIIREAVLDHTKATEIKFTGGKI